VIGKTKEEWQKIDKHKYEFKEVYCAFIDILGYKNKAELFFKNEYNLIERLDFIFEIVNFIDEMTSSLIDKSEKSVQVFSDSIIITYPVKEGSLSSLLHDINVISAQCSMHDLFIRGGLSKGKHIFTNTTKSNFSFLASEALQKAYQLEQTAKMPKILIDSELFQYFTEVDKLYVIKERDTFVSHFAPQLINREGNNELDVIAEMIDIQNRLSSEEDISIKEKYQWILDYYFWTVQNSNAFNMNNFQQFKISENIGFKELVL
jgi:hypothetical protein